MPAAFSHALLPLLMHTFFSCRACSYFYFTVRFAARTAVLHAGHAGCCSAFFRTAVLHARHNALEYSAKPATNTCTFCVYTTVSFTTCLSILYHRTSPHIPLFTFMPTTIPALPTTYQFPSLPPIGHDSTRFRLQRSCYHAPATSAATATACLPFLRSLPSYHTT